VTINEYLAKHKVIKNEVYEFRELTPKVECADGFTMSVQVSENHYCYPRTNNALYYDQVEVGFPNEYEELLMPFVEGAGNPTETVYGWVPNKVVDEVIIKHGGFKNED
jgi:hypothetical protein